MKPLLSRPNWRADLALTFVAFIWGATFVLVKRALDDASTLLFLALRFSLATFALALYFRIRRGSLPSSRVELRAGLYTGTCLFAAYAFQTFGLRFTTPSKSAFLTGLFVVFVPLFAAVTRRKLPHAFEWLGVVLATAGTAFMTLRGWNLAMGLGDLLTLFCAASYAVHILVVGHYSGKVGFESLGLLQIATATVLSLSVFWWAETPAIRWTPTLLLAVGVTGVLATALAFTVQAWAQQRTSPTHTALIFALEPVFAGLTSFFVEGEILSRLALLGAGLILSGILIVELRPSARQKPLPQ